MTLRKWDVAWAALDPTRGRGQAGKRPVLVLCNERIAARIALVTVLPITSRKKGRRVYPTEVMLPAGYGDLPVDSLVLCHQVRTLAPERLSPPAGRVVEPEIRRAVVNALRLWLDGLTLGGRRPGDPRRGSPRQAASGPVPEPGSGRAPSARIEPRSYHRSQEGPPLDLDPETVKKLDPLTLTNTITVSALVGVLIRKGILTDAELVQEIRALRAKIGIAERAQREGEK